MSRSTDDDTRQRPRRGDRQAEDRRGQVVEFRPAPGKTTRVDEGGYRLPASDVDDSSVQVSSGPPSAAVGPWEVDAELMDAFGLGDHAATIDRPAAESYVESRATIDDSATGRAWGATGSTAVARAHAYHERHPEEVQQFNELTAIDRGAPLPDGARSRLEATAGQSLGDVRVRDDGDAQALAASYDARAVTIGQTIHVGAGEDLASDDGQRLLAHETAHTIQQAQSGAASAAAKPLAATTPADPAEREADRFADAAMAGRTFPIGESLVDVAALDRKRSGQSADELTRDRDGENAYLTVRAYDAQGGLVDLWTGPAFFHGDLPVEYVGTKKNGRWLWGRGGEADPRGAELKVNSDEEGKSGMPVAQWAPDSAVQVIASVRGLMNPFENRIVIDDSGPLTMIGRFAARDADGATPSDLDAPGRLTGPLQSGATAQSGDLLVEQGERTTTFWLGHSVLRVTAPTALTDYAFTVEPQTSPRQRVIEIVGVAGVDVDLDNDADSAQLVYHLATVPPGQVPKHGVAGGAGVVLPEIVVVGDSIRCDLLLDGSRIHVEAVEPGAKFAYWIDPEWSGEHGETRAVHIVATPGVRVDELAAPQRSRGLAANPIYVQDPDRVPDQGTPIDPADYLGAESLQYGAREQDAATVYTGADSVTIRDHDRGVYVAITVVDPSHVGRFAWTLERPTEPDAPPAFRVLVGPGVHVHVHQITEPGPTRAPQFPYQDFGVDIDLRQADDPEKIPPQGTELTADLLAGFGIRQPDSRSYADPLDFLERHAQTIGDVAVGVVPGVGDAVDLAEAATGISKWGGELTIDERIIMGIAALLPFVPGAIAKAGRVVRGLSRVDSELAAFAAKLGKTEAEVEALLATLRRLDDDAQAAVRKIEEAIRSGGTVDAADLARVDHGLRAIGLGGMPNATRGGLRPIQDPTAPRVRAPDGVSADDVKRAAPDGAPATRVPAPDLDQPPPLARQIDRVAGVEKGAAYEEAQAQLREFYGGMEAEAHHARPVRGRANDGAYEWDYGHDAREFSHGVVSIELRIHLDPSSTAVTPADIARLQEQITKGVDDYYNYRHELRGADGRQRRLHLEVTFVDAPGNAHLTVQVMPGNAYDADVYKWYVHGDPTTHAHEVGHAAFGLKDEYFDASGRAPDRATPNGPGVHTDGSLMGNYFQGSSIDPTTELKPRHLDHISGEALPKVNAALEQVTPLGGPAGAAAAIRRYLTTLPRRGGVPASLARAPTEALDEGERVAHRARVAAELSEIRVTASTTESGRTAYAVTPADGERMRALFGELDDVRVREYATGFTVHHQGRDWFFEWSKSGAHRSDAIEASSASDLGVPAPNASVIEIHGFRGLKTVRGIPWKELPAAEREVVEDIFADYPLLRYGHVGLSFDGGKAVYGLNPPIDGTATMRAEEVNERVFKHDPVPGIVSDDAKVFEVASKMAREHGWDTEVTIASQLVTPEAKESARAQTLGLSRSNETHGKQYQWPYRAPDERGSYFPDDHTRNCATFPQLVGVCVPERSGQLSEYMPELRRWADRGPFEPGDER